MTDQSGLRPADRAPKTTMYRRNAEGGLEAVPESDSDYRATLRSRRWNAAPLANPEAEKTDPRIAVALIVGVALASMVILIVGYGVGLWSLPA